jgi:hypothetical protein
LFLLLSLTFPFSSCPTATLDASRWCMRGVGGGLRLTHLGSIYPDKSAPVSGSWGVAMAVFRACIAWISVDVCMPAYFFLFFSFLFYTLFDSRLRFDSISISVLLLIFGFQGRLSWPCCHSFLSFRFPRWSTFVHWLGWSPWHGQRRRQTDRQTDRQGRDLPVPSPSSSSCPSPVTSQHEIGGDINRAASWRAGQLVILES